MKRIALLSYLLALLVLMCGCTAPLDSCFDQEKLEGRMREDIAVLTAGDYGAMVELLREDMRTDLTGPDLEGAWHERLDELGTFQKIGDVVYTGMEEEEIPYAVAVVGCRYENGNAIFCLTYDPDYLLVGMYLK